MYTVTITNIYSDDSLQPATKYQVTKKKITIGRDSRNDIVLNQTNISSKHAMLKMTRKGILLSDLNSTNGIIVDGLRLTAPIIVNANQEIVMGGSRIELSDHPSLGVATKKTPSVRQPSSQAPTPQTPKSKPMGQSTPPIGDSSDSYKYNTPVSDTAFPKGASSNLSPLSMLLSENDAKELLGSPSKDLLAQISPKEEAKTPQVSSKNNLSFLIPGHSNADEQHQSTGSTPDQIAAPKKQDIPFPQESLPPSNQQSDNQFPLESPDLSTPMIPISPAANSVPIVVISLSKISDNDSKIVESRKFAQMTVTIGRLPNNDFPVQCNRVSSSHAMIEVRDNIVYIVDKNSSNGTIVNGQKISQPTPIGPTDRVYIGSFCLFAELKLPSTASPNVSSPGQFNSSPTATPQMTPPAHQTSAPDPNLSTPGPLPNSAPQNFPVVPEPFPSAPSAIPETEKPLPSASPFPWDAVSAQEAGAPSSTPTPASTNPIFSEVQPQQIVEGHTPGMLSNDNSYSHTNSQSPEEMSFRNNFHSLFVSIELAKNTLFSVLEGAQDLGVRNNAQLRQKCAILSSIQQDQYQLKPTIDNLQSVLAYIDRSISALSKAIVAFATDTDTVVFVKDLARAMAILYPFSTENATHPAGPMGIPGLFVVENAQNAINSKIETNDAFATETDSLGTLVARFMILADFYYYQSVSAIANSMADAFFLDPIQSKTLECALDEACANVIEHAFEIPGAGKIYVSIFANNNDNELIVAVDDKGLPFDLERANQGLLDGLGLTILRKLCKRVEFVNMHRHGKRVKFALNLPAQFTGIFTTPQIESKKFSPITSSTPFTIESASSDAAEEITKCLVRAHGYNFYEEQEYQIGKVRKRLEENVQQSVLAYTQDRLAVGHMCLIKDTPATPSAVLSKTFIAPPLRTSNMVSKLMASLIDSSRHTGLQGISYNATILHPYEQVSFKGIGGQSVGILLGYTPIIAEQNIGPKRQSALSMYLKLSSELPQSVYLPTRYAGVLESLYNKLALERVFLEVPQAQNAQRPAISNIKIFESAGQGIAEIKVWEYGDDLLTIIQSHLTRFKSICYSCVYIDLPLRDFATIAVTSAIEKMGFFFCGLVPQTEQGDMIRLQYLIDFKIDWTTLVMNEPADQALLTFVAQDEKRAKQAL